ncbi:hypothetical protein RAS1_38810 [Phycisphaerae bacterium RAS1]|nr:hypothetical protein RAS1_38810 [Phycisphaerae bacterium RAS1]
MFFRRRRRSPLAFLLAIIGALGYWGVRSWQGRPAADGLPRVTSESPRRTNPLFRNTGRTVQTPDGVYRQTRGSWRRM